MGKVLRVRARKEPGLWRAGIYWSSNTVFREVSDDIAAKVVAEPLLNVVEMDSLPLGWSADGVFTPPGGESIDPPGGESSSHVETAGELPPVEDEPDSEMSGNVPSKPKEDETAPPAHHHKRRR
jgi:hypothetical protein